MVGAFLLAAAFAWPAWHVAFDGYGSVRVVSDSTFGSALELQPAIASGSAQTHAALAISSARSGDFDERLTERTVRQLRTGSNPNPWETGWVLWHFSDNEHFYYLALKPNGWELGKEDPAFPDDQRFLATGSAPAFPVGSNVTVRIVQRANTVTAYAGGVRLTTFTDNQSPYLSGTFGLYCEDAQVRFTQPAFF